MSVAKQYKIKFVLSLLLAFSAFMLQAQEVKKTEMKSYKGKTGKVYWNKNMPVYIRLASSPSDTGQILKSKENKPYYFDTEGVNRVRSRWATDSLGKVLKPKKEEIWEVYADSRAPRSIIDYFDSEPFELQRIRYFGRNLHFDILAADRLSGVAKTYYSINGDEYKEFTGEMTISGEGNYILKYYSIDNVGNVEKPKTENFSLDLSTPISHHTILGGNKDNIFSPTTKVQFSAEDSISGISQIYYKIDDGKENKYSGGALALANLENGDHKISYYSLDNVQNKEIEKSFSFYLDKLAPILSSTIIGDQFVKNGKVYFSGRSMLKLTGVDDKSGLKEIQYAIDGKTFETYDEPFYIPSISGLHTIKYFALDNMENKTQTKRVIDAKYENYIINEDQIYVDVTAPSIKYDFLGTNIYTRDTLFVGGNTQFRIKGRDSESGIASVVYNIDGKDVKNTYSIPFTLKDLESGKHTMKITCFDNVNNKSERMFSFVLDNTPPEIKYNFSVSPYAKRNGLDIYPEYATLYLAATDLTIGAKTVTYSLNDAISVKYTGEIKGFIKNKENKVTITATDRLGNETVTVLNFYIQ